MKLFEGKSKTERNKIIAAMVLGFMCLVVFYFAFLRGMFSGGGGTTTVNVKTSPTPKTASTRSADSQEPKMPSQGEQDFAYQTLPIDYRPGRFGAPDPGRNIFAFYEPPLPTPFFPTPVFVPPTPPPTPGPTPPMTIALLNPQSLYAGSKGIRLEVAGDNFTPDTRIYFEQQEMPTSFVSAQRLTADIPGVLLTGDGQKRIMAQTGNGTLYSNPVMLEVQPAPKPQFLYIGAKLYKRSNNDTAVFREEGQNKPEFAARLSDVVGGRFRLVSISAQETILEDINLGFRHKLPLFLPPPGTAAPQPPGGRGGFPARETYVPFNPPPPGSGNTRIPGIPDNIPRYIPPASNSNRPANVKKDIDDDEDTDNE